MTGSPSLQSQPAYIIRMRAKPGGGDRLFKLATAGMAKSDASDRFIILREDGDPDVLWNIEVFRSDEAKDAYESSPLAEQLRDEILDLLAEPPMRVKAHPYAAAPYEDGRNAPALHPKPVGPATDLIGEMDEAINKDRSRKR